MKAVSLCCFFLLVVVSTGINAVQTVADSRPVVSHQTDPASGNGVPIPRGNSRQWNGWDMTAKGRGLNLSPVINKITNYISSYTSTAATWLTYPYYGVSTGVTSLIVVFVVLYILILVSGTAVTTGRSLMPELGVDHEDLNRLTQTIYEALDSMVDDLGNDRLDDPSSSDRSKRGILSGDFGSSWSATVSSADSFSEYISDHLYDKLIWMSKPYAGQILCLAAVILFMIVIVIITMTSGVFPISTSGRQLHDEFGGLDSTDLIRAAEAVMKAINAWEARKERHGEYSKEN